MELKEVLEKLNDAIYVLKKKTILGETSDIDVDLDGFINALSEDGEVDFDYVDKAVEWKNDALEAEKATFLNQLGDK